MARYCDGDDRAFRALYALAAPRLFAYLTCLVRDRSLADELLQQTFIKLHNARATYVRGADPLPWMYTIAHRICLDEFRRVRRSRVRLGCDLRGIPEAPATLEGSAESARPDYDERTIEATLEALDALPDNQRLALVLTKIQGKSMAEAAVILGTTPGAVKLRAHRAYVALREILGTFEAEER
jgi:RNA polymerase sigma-70 factor (ECF subfamily)